MFRLLKFGFCLLFGLSLAAPASSQIFKIEGGTSTLFDSDGGNISIKAPNYDGTFGAGIYPGPFSDGGRGPYQGDGLHRHRRR